MRRICTLWIVLLLAAGCGTGASPEEDAREHLADEDFPEELIDRVVHRAALSNQEIDRLISEDEESVLFLLAGNPHLPLEYQDAFAGHEDDLVRSGLARNPSLSRKNVERLVKDPSQEVRSALAGNPNVERR
jgi:hypothetical protein